MSAPPPGSGALRSQLRDLLDADWDNGYVSLCRAYEIRRVAKALAAAHRADWPGPLAQLRAAARLEKILATGQGD